VTAATGAGRNVFFLGSSLDHRDMQKGRCPMDTSLIGWKIGRSRSSARWRSAKRRHLKIGSLSADVLAGVLDLALVGLPAFADDVLVGCDGTLGRHAQRM